MRLLYLPLHLVLFSLGSSFILFPEDISGFLNVLYSGLPTPIRFGMNVTKVGVGFRIGRNVDVQTLVEMGALVTTTTNRPSVKRNIRHPSNPATSSDQLNASNKSISHFFARLWGRQPALKLPTKPPHRTKTTIANSTSSPQHDFPQVQDVSENEIES